MNVNVNESEIVGLNVICFDVFKTNVTQRREFGSTLTVSIIQMNGERRVCLMLLSNPDCHFAVTLRELIHR